MKRASYLRQRAERYRGMKGQISDPAAVQAMSDLADEYEMTAAELEKRHLIRERAYRIWIEQGSPQDRDVQNWEAAERELASQQQG